MNFRSSKDFAKQLDLDDPLRKFRKRFFIADKNTIYLDGNSLGRLPLKTKTLVTDVVENQWGSNLIESWNKNWYTKSVKLGKKIARIIGAADNEVVVTDSTSVNLYKLVHAVLKFQKGRKKIVSDVFNFPTDIYILKGLANDFGNGYELDLARAQDEISIDLPDLKAKIDENTACVVLSLVAFKSSFLYNALEITKWAHEKGALILWDLSHAAGAIPIELNKINADLAVGCTYKYLNGGPGSPSFLYIRNDLQEKLFSPIQGWFGDEDPFKFNLEFQPAEGIKKFLAGTPPVLSLLAIEPGLDIILEAGIEKMYQKSILQTGYLLFLTNEFLIDVGFQIGSPPDHKKRGSHISLKHPEAYRICQALIHPPKLKKKVIPDFREPDNIRLGITPLYTSFIEIHQTVERLKEIVLNKEFKSFSRLKKGVT